MPGRASSAGSISGSRPAVARAQRDDQRQDRGGQPPRTGQVEPRAAGPLADRQPPGGEGENREAGRHVYQEDRPPSGAQHVGADQDAAEHLPGGHPDGEDHPVQRQGTPPALAVEGDLQHGQHLRDQQRGAQPLGGTGRHQHDRAHRQPAGQRADREDRDAVTEQAPEPVPPAQPRSGDQRDRIHQQVGVDRELQPGTRQVQVVLDRRARHVDDRRVERGHGLAGEHRRGQRPGGERAMALALPLPGRRARDGRRGEPGLAGHRLILQSSVVFL